MPTVNALVVSPPSPVWGAQLYLLGQVEPLAERGVHLTLGSPRGSAFADEWEARGLALLDLPLRLHEGLRIPGSTQRPGLRSMLGSGIGVLQGISTLTRVARRFDLMYSFSLKAHLETAIAGRLARVPVALDLVDMVQPGVGQRVLRTAARLSTLTVANSRATAAAVGEASAVEIIHPAIDLHQFRPGPVDCALRRELTGGVDRPLVAVIGRLDVKKGVQYLVDAMHQLEGDVANARLVVVGEAGTGPAEFADQLRRDASALLGDRVVFLGRRTDIPEILRAVDVLVVASISEPFGLTALEAQACRTPVIGTDAGGLPEFVIDGETGLLVPPMQAEPLARAIERLLGDAALRQRLVDEAERRANPARGLEAQYDQLAQMYRDVASRATGAKQVHHG